MGRILHEELHFHPYKMVIVQELTERDFTSRKNAEIPRAEACFRAERCGDCKTEVLTASMFSGDLMGRGTPVLRRFVLPVRLNVSTHVTIDFRSGTGPLGATLNEFERRAVLQ